MEQETKVRIAQVEPVWETAHIKAASIPREVSMLRRRVMEFFNSASSLFSQDELSDVELAVGEACLNAFKHGSPKGESDEVRVKCMKSERTLIAEVSDNGYGFNPSSIPIPSPNSLAETGIGIFLMRTIMNSVEFKFGGGTTVRLVKHCRQR